MNSTQNMLSLSRIPVGLICIMFALPVTVRSYHRPAHTVRSDDVDLKRIFREITTTPAATLVGAAALSYRNGKLEDAAFLYYAAQLRLAHDRIMYPAKESGGDSPFLAFGAIAAMLGPEINGALSSQPKVQREALLRLQKWVPATGRAYTPGWRYAERQPETSVLPAYRRQADTFMTAMMGSCTLMLDPDFFDAFHYLKKNCIRRAIDTTACDERRETMERIASDKGLQDLLPHMIGR